MNLYRITRIGRTNYDEHAGFVVAAETETDARRLASDRDYGTTFSHAGLSHCQAIGTAADGISGVILSGYHAG